MIAAAALGLASFAFSLVVLVVARRELRALVPLASRPLSSPLTVIIPARNEPEIALCLDAVLADTHAGLRVIVVDDRSTDDTAARAHAVCARDARAQVLSLTDDPPAGVFGKPRALQAGADRAGPGEGPLLFLDADVVLAPGALGALLDAHAKTGADALSGVPRLETRSLVEQLLVPTLASLVTSRFLPSRVHDARTDVAFLNGQMVLVTRAALEVAGGWASVQASVLEDVALARRLKRAGRALRLCDVRALASTRMYDGLSEIVEGFGKNAVALLGPAAGLIAMVSLVMACMPWVSALGALLTPALTDADSALRALAVTSALCAVSFAVFARQLAGVARWPALVLPLAYAGVSVILLRATWRHLRRAPVLWKGRQYPPRVG